MPTYRPGRKNDAFHDRCIARSDRSILQRLGDHNVVIGSTRGSAFFERDPLKIELDDVAISSSTIEIEYMNQDFPYACKGDQVLFGGRRFEIREQPRDQFDGWSKAFLKYCGLCK